MIISRVAKPVESEVSIRPELIVPWWEVLGVSLVMLGVGIVVSAVYGLTHPSGSFYLLFSDRLLLFNTGFQAAMLAGFLFYLRLRGWRPADLRIHPGWVATARALEVLILTYIGFWAVAEISQLVIALLKPAPYGFLAYLFVPSKVPVPTGGFQVHWFSIIIACVVNAYFEELVYMGYGFNLWAAKYGARTAVLFSILGRLSVHTYQGSGHILPIAVWAVLFGVWYRYHRNVWQLIFAHAMLDLFTFGKLKIYYGAL